MKLTVLVDNAVPVGSPLYGESGLALYLECDGKRLLFDTGASELLFHNAALLGIDLLALDYIVLSHHHSDHTGGLAALAEKYAALPLERRPELTEQLSAAAKRRRNFQCTHGSYRWAAMAITLLGFAALAYGIVSFVRHGSFSIYFTLFGLAAIFTFAGFSVLPTARNNRTSIMQNDAQAQEKMQAYLADYLNFPLPARYAHPVVLRRMQRAVMDGRAVTAAQALDVVKADLKALNADVTVSQEEYDEVVAIKPMFLNAEYQ